MGTLNSGGLRVAPWLAARAALSLERLFQEARIRPLCDIEVVADVSLLKEKLLLNPYAGQILWRQIGHRKSGASRLPPSARTSLTSAK